MGGLQCSQKQQLNPIGISFPVAKPKSWFQNMLALVLLDTTALEVQPCLSPAHLAPLDLGLSLAQR